MSLADLDGSDERFLAYVEGLASVIGHADRVDPLRDYCVGLMLPCERKSVEPMAAVTAPARTAAQHQSLLHFVGEAAWSDEKVLAKVREMVLPEIERHGPIEAWIIDDTGFPKKGKHSVGVARQYCGQLGKQDNCQVAVSLSIANRHASLPVSYRLYLPEEWASNQVRRDKAGVPEDIGFQTKPEIALDQMRCGLRGRPSARRCVDGCGLWQSHELAQGDRRAGTTYVAGILPNTTVWAPGTRPLRAESWSGRGQPPKRMRRDAKHKPLSVKQLAFGFAQRRLAKDHLARRPRPNGFPRALHGCVYARPIAITISAHYPAKNGLLIEWPKGEKEPTKYWLSTLPADITFERLVDLAKLRWRIERDYQELKQELGLGHFEGRGWRGFHHHATLCIAAYGFLISERETISPSAPRPAALLPQLAASRRLQTQRLPRLRPERHIANSIATMRRRLIHALVRNMPRCPCCARRNPRKSSPQLVTQ